MVKVYIRPDAVDCVSSPPDSVADAYQSANPKLVESQTRLRVCSKDELRGSVVQVL